ncbi:MAG: MG2 domain-containing protein [Lentimicrobiaceae bacterium]|nr:MG2 domain-containing protein [Lentimicrobiaceae bacterium]
MNTGKTIVAVALTCGFTAGYAQQGKRDNEVEIFKSQFETAKSIHAKQENGLRNAVFYLDSILPETQPPYNGIFNLMIANYLMLYKNWNNYQITNRTYVKDTVIKNIETWSAQNFNDACLKHYLIAYEQLDSMAKMAADDFEFLLNKEQDIRHLKPTVMDAAAQLYLSHNNYLLGQSLKNVEGVRVEDLLKPCSEFLQIEIPLSLKDSNLATYFFIKTFQKVMGFHANQIIPNKEILIDYELIKLSYLKNILPDKDSAENSLYFKTLELLDSLYRFQKGHEAILFQKALYYKELGNKYKYSNSDTKPYQDYLKVSHALFGELKNRKNNYVAHNAAVLFAFDTLQTITNRSVCIYYSNNKLLLPVNYLNIDSVYLSIYKVKPDDLHGYSKDSTLIEFIKNEKKAQYIKTELVTLENPNDFQTHAADILIDDIGVGNYYFVFHTEKSLDVNNLVSSLYGVATSTRVNKLESRKKILLLTLHADNGKPIPYAKLKIHHYVFYDFDCKTWRIANRKGIVSKSSALFRINDIEVHNKNDIYKTYLRVRKRGLQIRLPFYIGNRKEIDIFTDRQIYRPGQTVYLKALCTKNRKKVLANKTISAEVLDANRKKIYSFELKTNKFGSIDTSFQIPADCKTGSFLISAEMKHARWNDGYNSFHVEEYKRPNFEIKFDDIKQEYKLGDSVYVSGDALSYSGTPLSYAKAKYTIQAESPSHTVSGELACDNAGKFNIPFLSKIPDNSACESVMHYITIEITDINGETQTQKTNFTLKRKSLFIHLDMPDINLTAFNSLSDMPNYAVKVLVRNAANFEISAPVEAKIEQLQPELPKTNFVKFDHPKPDYPLDNQVYESYFNKSYSDYKTNKKRWAVKKTVLTQTFNSLSDSLRIPDYKNWEAGIYRTIVSVSDKDGNSMTDTALFYVYDALGKNISKFEEISINFASFDAEKGKKLNIAYSSVLKDASVYVLITANNKVKKRFWLPLNQEQKTKAFKVRRWYKGFIGVEAYVLQNGITYSGRNYTFVYNPKDVQPSKKAVKHAPLQIETEHLSSTLTPGEQETWRLKIPNLFPKQQAEILALLYDCSLDQFAKNTIDFPTRSYQKRYYFGGNFALSQGRLEFGRCDFPRFSNNLILKKYETLNLFHRDFNYRLYNDLGIINLANSRGYFFVNSFYWYDYGEEESYGGELRTLACLSVGSDITSYRGNRVSDATYFMNFVDGAPERSIGRPVAKRKASSVTLSCPVFSMEEDAHSHRFEEDFENGSPCIVYLDSIVPLNDYQPFSSAIQIRKNFNETAFFYPKLQTDKDGGFVIAFTAPESLTKWKFLALAHTKNLRIANVEKFFQTQKTMMLIPNRPRFLREGDTMAFSIKIANLSDSVLNGKTKIEFFDAQTNQPLDMLLPQSPNVQDFRCENNTAVEWRVSIPKNVSTIGYKVVAQAGNYSDGEEYVFPVLPKRMLVTETMPLYINGNAEKTFYLEKLQNNASASLENYSYTLEFTANPAWYAVQSLPYLMEYRYDCNEQIFSKLYANAIGLHIVQSNSKIKEVFDAWSKEGSSLESKLTENEELKNILLEETPWVKDAETQTQRLQNLGKLFNTQRMQKEINSQIYRLQLYQNSNGSWGWFKGLGESEYITQHIVAGIGHLKALQIDIPERKSLLTRSHNYLDKQHAERFKEGVQYIFSSLDAHYLYARSFSFDTAFLAKPHVLLYLGEAERLIYQQDLYTQTLLALAFHRFGKKDLAKNCMESIRQQAFTNEEMGMYWKTETDGGYYSWHQAPIERQALLIEAFSEIDPKEDEIEKMKLWLLKQKQTQAWSNTKATAEACYALLLRGTDLLSADNNVNITVGYHHFNPSQMDSVKSGTSYFKTTWIAEEITPEMGKIEIKKSSGGSAYGAVYWQYFEDLDKITSANTGLKIDKKLYKVIATPSGEELQEITDSTPIQLGNKIVVRMIITTDRDLEYVHLKDMRASAFEPTNVFSTAKRQNGIWYYESTRDAATNFFFSRLNKGTHVFEYRLTASQKGDFSNGIATIQCMYAPEFSAHSEGGKVVIGE